MSKTGRQRGRFGVISDESRFFPYSDAAVLRAQLRRVKHFVLKTLYVFISTIFRRITSLGKNHSFCLGNSFHLFIL